MAIKENPDDDAIRLVYSDWLKDHGEDVRGEFIRQQVMGKKLSYACQRYIDKLYWIGEDRNLIWIIKHIETGYLWSGGNDFQAVITTVGAVSFHWLRGFISLAMMPYKLFEEHGKSIAANHPLETVSLSSHQPWCAFNHRWGWSCHPDDDSWRNKQHDSSWVLSKELFAFLPPTSNGLPKSAYRRWYRSENEANQHLSDACVKWANK